MTQQTDTTAPATSATGPLKPDDRSTAFQPVEGGGEQRSGATLLIEAYVVLWLLLMAWILVMWRKQAAMTARLGDLEKALDRAAAKAAKK